MGGAMPVAVETMASTPNSQSAMDSANDKKRNKLGYHRTSVACGQSPHFPFSPAVCFFLFAFCFLLSVLSYAFSRVSCAGQEVGSHARGQLRNEGVTLTDTASFQYTVGDGKFDAW